MANPIVTVNISQTVAPTSSNLQKTGAIVSQGGTLLSIGSFALLAQVSDLTPLLAASLALTSLSYSGGVVTATTTAAHGIPTNTVFPTTIAGAVPGGYNGTFFATATGASTFTYYLAASPGSETTPGTYTPNGVAELVSQVTMFFTQMPGTQSIYVLEVGAGIPSAGVSALSAFINAQPQIFYSYEVPRSWGSEPTFITFAESFTSNSAKTYFFVTVNLQNYTAWTAAAPLKSVLAITEAPLYPQGASQTVAGATWAGNVATLTTGAAHGLLPNNTFTVIGILSATIPAGYNGTFIALPGTTGSTLKYALAANPGTYTSGGAVLLNLYGSSAGIPATEFDAAAPHFVTLNYNPSPTNKVTPLFTAFLFGVTPFPTMGNGALIQTIDAANINYIGTGAEGGISNRILFEGHMLDGRPFNYWYSVDWMAINLKQQLAATIINGSNNQINPLYYSQDGIDRLLNTAVSTAGRGVANGLVLGRVIQTELDATTFSANLNSGLYAGNCVVNAVPFVSYLTANPSHYKLGIYNGLSVTFTPTRAFESITVNINVTDFVVG